MKEFEILNQELNKFWEWANMSFQEYMTNRKAGEWEVNYERWDDIYESIKDLIFYINNNNIEDILFSKLLEALAIDNEAEIIKENLIDNLKNLSLLIKYGHTHNCHHVRWQIVDMITGQKSVESEDILIKMFKKEKDKYVLRKILLGLSEINSNKVEELAFQQIKNTDEYVRLAAIRILKKHNSIKLDIAYEIMQNDNSKLIKEEIQPYSKLKQHGLSDSC